MLRWTIALLTFAVLAGCVDEADPVSAPESLEVYRFSYPGSQAFIEDGGDSSQGGALHGLLWRLHNNGTSPLTARHDLTGADGRFMVWSRESTSVDLAPGESKAVMLLVSAYESDEATVTWRYDGQSVKDTWTVQRLPAQQRVMAGHEVHTVTVGVWENGTSFYTNSPELLADPAFPAGGHIIRANATAAAAPLPVYVYATDRTDQPGGSRDRCFITTISGYNALLRTQTLHSTGIRYLAPEEGYTRPGSEEHLLYGDALIFLNTVVAHHGGLTPTESAPDPTAACFGAENHVPEPPLDAWPTR